MTSGYLLWRQRSQPRHLIAPVVAILMCITWHVAVASTPTFVTGYPIISDRQATSAKVSVAIDQPGTFSFVVLNSGSNAPSAADVLARTGSGGTGCVASGTQDVSASNTVAAASASGLSTLTNYDIYVVAQDVAANAQANPTKLSFTTGATIDMTAPAFVTGYPTVTATTSSSVTIKAQLDESGTCYYMIVSSTSATPTATQVKNGVNPGGGTLIAKGSVTEVGGAPVSITVSLGLTASTTYKSYTACQDNAPTPNLQASARMTVFTTGAPADFTPPVWGSGFPRLQSATDASLVITAQINEPGAAYYILAAAGAVTPSAAQVKSGLLPNGATPVATGRILLPIANQAGSASVSGLPSATNFVYFVVAEDSASPPNLQGTATSFAAATIADCSPPIFVAGSPAVIAVSDADVCISVQQNEPGTVFVVVGPTYTTRPTVSQVLQGIDGGGEMPSAAGLLGIVDGNVDYQLTLSALPADTDYWLCAVSQDLQTPSPNVQSMVTCVTFSTLPDTTAPVPMDGFPIVIDVADWYTQLVVAMSEPVTMFIMVLPTSSIIPTSQQVLNFQSPDPHIPIALATTLVVSQAWQPVSFQASPLAAQTAYTLYLVAVDWSPQQNVQQQMIMVNITTLPDRTPPSFVVNYPSFVNCTDSQMLVAARFSEPCWVYAMLQPAGDPYPSLSKVMEASAGSNRQTAAAPLFVPAAGAEVYFRFDHLTASSKYVVYFVSQDVSPAQNLVTAPTWLPVQTGRDVTPPFWYTAPIALNITDGSVLLQFAVSEASIVYLAAVAAIGSSLVTSALVVDGGLQHFSHVNASASMLVAAEISGLAASTAYHVYLVAVDELGNDQAQPTMLTITTAIDRTPPSWVPGFPSLTNVTDSLVTVQTALSEPAAVYMLVEPISSTSGSVSAAQLMVQAQTSGVYQGTPTVLTVSGLLHDTSYTIALVASDVLHNTQRQVAALTVRTKPDATPPVWTATPAARNITDSSITVVFGTNEEATVVAVLARSPSETMTPQAVIAAAAAQSIMCAVSSACSLTWSGLDDNTAFVVQLVAMDTARNHQFLVTHVTTSTMLDYTPPLWVEQPSAFNITDSSITVIGVSSESGMVFASIVHLPHSILSAQQVQAHPSMQLHVAAGSAFTLTLSGLDYASQYAIVLAAQDDLANLQTHPLLLTVTTAADATPPHWIVEPSVSNATDSSGWLTFQSSEIGWLHLHVQSDAGAVVLHTVKQVSHCDSLQQAQLTGLPAHTQMTVSVYAQDANGNAQHSAVNVRFFTLSDETPPTWRAAPFVRNRTDSAIELQVSVSETSDVFGLLLSPTSPLLTPIALAQHPSAVQVHVQNSTVGTLRFEDLPCCTHYDLLVVAADTAGNFQSHVTAIAAQTTADVTPPRWLQVPVALNITDSTVNLRFQLSEPGTVWVLAQLSILPVPSVQQIRNVTRAPSSLAHVAVAVQESLSLVTFQELPDSTAITVYFVAYDGAGNVQPSITSLSVTTIRDRTPPLWYRGGPTVTFASDQMLTITARLSEAGYVLAAVAQEGHALPSVATLVSTATVNVSVSAQQWLSFNLTGLKCCSRWDVALVAIDVAGNAQQFVTIVDGITTADVTPPQWSIVPFAHNVSDSACKVSFLLSEPGTVHLIWTPAVEAVPSMPALSACNDGCLAIQSATEATLRDLQAGTAYNAFLLAIDTVGNTQRRLTIVAFITLPDATPPKWGSAMPSIINVTDSAFAVSVIANEPSIAFARVVPAGGLLPTSAELQLQHDSIADVGNLIPQVLTFSGLHASTEYELIVVLQDSMGNLQPLPTVLDVTTGVDVTAPLWQQAPTALNITDSAVVISAQLSEPGTVWCSILLAQLASPTIAQIVAEGVARQSNSQLPIVAEFGGLLASQAYTLSCAAADDLRNFQTIPFRLAISTHRDVTAPRWVGLSPALTAVTDETASFSCQVNEPSTLHLTLATCDGALIGTQSSQQNVTAWQPVVHGLWHDTCYVAHVLAEDALGNRQVESAVINFVSGNDRTAPIWTLLPLVQNNSDSSVRLTAACNEVCTMWYLVQAPELPVMSVSSLKASLHATRRVMNASSIMTGLVSSLHSATQYVVYIAAEDAVGNAQSDVTAIHLRTADDVTPPVWVMEPMLASKSDSSLVIRFAISESGRVMHKMRTSGHASTAVQLQHRFDHVVQANASAAVLQLTGLAANTTYWHDLIAMDLHGNTQSMVFELSTTTKVDETAPKWLQEPSVANVTDSSLVISFLLNEAGIAVCGVQAAEEPVPSAGSVFAHRADMLTVHAAADGEGFTSVELLSASTSYTVFCVAADLLHNRQLRVVSVTVRTRPDATPPTWVTGLPALMQVTDSSITVQVAIREPGTIFAVIAHAPVSAAVVASQAMSVVLVNATSPATIGFAGLVAGTEYVVTLVAEDLLHNLQRVGVSISATTLADQTPPLWLSPLQQVNVSDSAVCVSFQCSEPCSVHSLVTSPSDPVPLAGQLFSHGSQFSDGIISEACFRGLQHSTSYAIYAIAEDVTGNKQVHPSLLVITTSGDQTPPSWSIQPHVIHLNDSTVTVSMQLSEPGSLFIVKQLISQATPLSAAQVLLHPDMVVSAQCTFSTQVTASDLQYSSTYRWLMIAVDTTGNAMQTAFEVQFTTRSDLTPPAWVAAPWISNFTDSTVTVVSSMCEPGRVFVVLLPPTFDAPSPAAMVAGGLSDTVSVSGSLGETFRIVVTGLRAATVYAVYVVAVDEAGNRQPVATRLDVQTEMDHTPPTWVHGFPAVAWTTDSSFMVLVQLSEGAVAYMSLLRAGAQVPSPIDLVHNHDWATTTDVGRVYNMTSAGLPCCTTLTAVLVAMDMVGNVQRELLFMNITMAPDSHPPQWLQPFAIAGKSDGSVDTHWIVSEDSQVFVLVSEEGVVVTMQDVLEGRGRFKAAVGSIGQHETMASITGLQASTRYSVNAVAVDKYGNAQQTLSELQLETDQDRTPPRFGAQWPDLDTVTDSSAVLRLALSEPGTVWVTVSSNATGTHQSLSLSVLDTNPHELLIQSLAASTVYQVALTAVDVVGNTAAQRPTLLLETGVDVTPPAWIQRPYVMASAERTVSIAFEVSEPATVHVMRVAATGSTPPISVLQVASCQLHNCLHTYVNASSGMLVVDDLQPATNYTVLVVAADLMDPPNVQAVTSVLCIATHEDVSSPVFTVEPHLVQVDDASAIIEFAVSEPGIVYFAAVREGNMMDAAFVRQHPLGWTRVQDASLHSIRVSGLVFETSYIIGLEAVDTYGNWQVTPGTVPVRTTMDQTAPTWIDGFPAVVHVRDTSIILSIAISEPGRVWCWHSLLDPAPVPPVTTIVHDSQHALDIFDSQATWQFNITGLLANTSYVLFVVAEDASWMHNTQPSALRFHVTTAMDMTPPTMLASPRIVALGDRSGVVQVQLNEQGRAHFQVHSATDGQLAATGVAPASGNAQQFNVSMSSLRPDTDYMLSLTAEDACHPPNVATAPVIVRFRTLRDLTPPRLEGRNNAWTITEGSLALELGLDESCVVAFAVLPASATPSPSGIRSAAVLQHSVPYAVAFGSIHARGHERVSVTATGLRPNSLYTFLIVAQDDAGNAWQQPMVSSARTAEDRTPPSFLGGTPRVDGIYDTWVSISVQVSEASSVAPVLFAAHTTGNSSISATSMLRGLPSVAVPARSTQRLDVRSLDPSTAYCVRVVATDGAGNAAAPQMVCFQTAQDRTPPSITQLTVAGIQERALVIRLMTNEDCTVNVAIVASATFWQSIASIEVLSRTIADAHYETRQFVTGMAAGMMFSQLLPRTGYTMLFVPVDSMGNYPSMPVNVSASTLADTQAPTVDVALVAVTTNCVTVRVTVSEPAVVKLLVSETAMNASSMAQCSAANCIAVDIDNDSDAITLCGLASGSSLMANVLAADRAVPSNVMAHPSSLAFRTLVARIAADWVPPYPAISVITNDSALVQLMTNASCVVHVTLCRSTSAPVSLPAIVDLTYQRGTVCAGARFAAAQADARNVTSLHLTALQPETAYSLFATCSAAGVAESAPVRRLDFTTGVDTTPAMLSHVHVVGIGDHSAELSARVTKPGLMSYQVCTRHDPDVLAAAVSGALLPFCITHGSLPAAERDQDVLVSIGGLPASTSFHVLLTVSDALHSATAVWHSSFTTVADVTAPSFVAGTPRLEGVTDQSVMVVIGLSETGTVFADVFAAHSSRVLAESSLLSRVAMTVDVPNVPMAIVAAGDLTPGGQYSVQLTAVDASNNTFVFPEPMLFQTSDSSAGGVSFAFGFPAISMVSDTSTLVEVKLTTPGVVHSMVRLQAAPAATAAEVVSDASVTTAITEGHAVRYLLVPSLQPHTRYALSLLATSLDTPTGPSAAPVRLVFTTRAVAAPRFVSGYPRIVQVSDSQALVSVAVDRAARCSVVVSAQDSSSLSTPQVLRGDSGLGTTAFAIGLPATLVTSTIRLNMASLAGQRNASLTAFLVLSDTTDASIASIQPFAIPMIWHLTSSLPPTGIARPAIANVTISELQQVPEGGTHLQIACPTCGGPVTYFVVGRNVSEESCRHAADSLPAPSSSLVVASSFPRLNDTVVLDVAAANITVTVGEPMWIYAVACANGTALGVGKLLLRVPPPSTLGSGGNAQTSAVPAGPVQIPGWVPYAGAAALVTLLVTIGAAIALRRINDSNRRDSGVAVVPIDADSDSNQVDDLQEEPLDDEISPATPLILSSAAAAGPAKSKSASAGAPAIGMPGVILSPTAVEDADDLFTPTGPSKSIAHTIRTKIGSMRLTPSTSARKRRPAPAWPRPQAISAASKRGTGQPRTPVFQDDLLPLDTTPGLLAATPAGAGGSSSKFDTDSVLSASDHGLDKSTVRKVLEPELFSPTARPVYELRRSAAGEPTQHTTTPLIAREIVLDSPTPSLSSLSFLQSPVPPTRPVDVDEDDGAGVDPGTPLLHSQT